MSTKTKGKATNEKERKVDKLKKKTNIRDDDNDYDAPEEIGANTVEIQRLRELHEAMIAPSSRKRSKKKPRAEKEKVDENAALDVSLLDGLDDEDFVDGASEEEEEEEPSSIQRKRLKIDKTAKKSKQIGNITVSTLDQDDALSAFINTGKASKKSTLELIGSTAQRTRFGVFASQKVGGPAKVFQKR